MSNVITSKEKKKEAAKLTKKFGVEIDTRGGFEVIADLHKHGIDAVPIVAAATTFSSSSRTEASNRPSTFTGLKLFPSVGSPIGSQFCVTRMVIMSRTKVTTRFSQPQGNLEVGHMDIAALGDSSLHGYCVPSDKNFVALIRRDYPATLNLGVAGNGPLLMLAKLKEYLTA